jgi:hypothetical protein
LSLLEHLDDKVDDLLLEHVVDQVAYFHKDDLQQTAQTVLKVGGFVAAHA